MNELRQREEELTRAKSELDALRTERDELATQVDELRQRDEDLVKSQAELASVRGERDGLAARIARVDQINKSLTQKIENRTSTVERLERDRLALEATMQKAVHSATEQVAAAERARHEQQKAAQQAQSQMGARFQEIVTLTGLLRQEEHRSESIIGHLDWMRAVHESLTSQPRWWSLMPGTWRQEREKLRLKRHGLFDADIYLERYPDVAAAALDPLYHYMTHGFYEGRSKSA
jgi:chromosome segregation ATPase